ncbi:hypothetical protein [Segatella oulorum]|uniref:hypothetical protein n=1 Tax=Segatella oulorum TaxID=28136 RepID=UPI0023F2C082|nr:hypothetical protein [Segatella oulorum]
MKIKNKLSNEAWSRLRNRGLLVAVGAAALLAAACADDDLATDQPGKHTGMALAFNVSDAQMEDLEQAHAKGATRSLSNQPVSATYLAPQRLEATGDNPHDFCLIESTVEGLNPVKVDAKTRGTILTASTLGTFSSIGYRAASSAAASNPSSALLWFHNEKTNPDGTLQNRYDWDWPVNVYGRFYAVSPEATAANGITLSPSTPAQVPYVDFEVNQDVAQQKDLMTACSGEVHYIHGNDPTSNLKFRHALAAVKFSIGSNLSPVIIKKIEVSGVKYKGRYQLPNKADGSDAAWLSVDNATTTMTLDGINVDASKMPNTMLAGERKTPTYYNQAGCENYTFLMIPQTLPAKTATDHAKVSIYYEEGGTTKHVTFPLCNADGTPSVWKENTTTEYKLTQRKSGWECHLTVSPALTFSYQESSQGYTVNSYREGLGGTKKQPMPWKVVKYEESTDGGTTWTDKGMTKPAWLTNFSKTEGDGGNKYNGNVYADWGSASVRKDLMIDKLTPYNKVLKDATPKGSDSDPYNLANPGGNGARDRIEESANSYLISAPGHYCIPLIYGNAIRRNKTNRLSFHTDNTGPYILRDFLDHADQPITKALINEQNSTKMADRADIVWMDRPNLIHFGSSPIIQHAVTIDGTTKNVDFVKFEVTANDICNGNAVIAVKNSDGTVMWSWHLWFDHADALDLIPCKNHTGVVYKFTRNSLGYAHLKWEVTSYTKPRMARVTFQQIGGGRVAGHPDNPQEAKLIITQNPGGDREEVNALYEWGRKDALPNTTKIYPANAYKVFEGRVSVGKTIQTPGTYYYTRSLQSDQYTTTYANTWSTNNTKISNLSDDEVTKTIYDPCPAGFHMPASKAFSGFTTTGAFVWTNRNEYNVVGPWDYGWHFSTNNTPIETIFFPATGFLFYYDGQLDYTGEHGHGHYWSAFPSGTETAYFLDFNESQLFPGNSYHRSCGYIVRPVADTKTAVRPGVSGSTITPWGSDGSSEGGTIFTGDESTVAP